MRASTTKFLDPESFSEKYKAVDGLDVDGWIYELNRRRELSVSFTLSRTNNNSDNRDFLSEIQDIIKTPVLGSYPEGKNNRPIKPVVSTATPYDLVCQLMLFLNNANSEQLGELNNELNKLKPVGLLPPENSNSLLQSDDLLLAELHSLIARKQQSAYPPLPNMEIPDVANNMVRYDDYIPHNQLFRVDLSASTTGLTAEFKSSVKNVQRSVFPKQRNNAITIKKLLSEWVSNDVLPIIDLNLYSRINNTQLTFDQIAELIRSPDADTIRKDKMSRAARVLRSYQLQIAYVSQ